MLTLKLFVYTVVILFASLFIFRFLFIILMNRAKLTK